MLPIFKSKKYQIHLYKYLPEHIREFLNSIHWGSKGTIYERPVTQITAQRLYKPHVFVIENTTHIIATVLANAYSFSINNENVIGYYFRYFASNPLFRGNTLVANNSIRVLSWLHAHMQPNDFLYAYLEKKNDQSSKLVQRLGYQQIGESTTIGFSRFFPKKSDRVQQAITDAQQEYIRTKISSFYQKHALVHSQGIHLDNSYYYIEVDQKIVAGLQVIEGQWKILQMEGRLGKFIVKYASRIPFINRLFSPEAFRFLGVEGILYEKGQEKILFELLEHILAIRKRHSALIWQDPKCPYYLGNYSCLGILHTFVKGTGSYILAKGSASCIEELSQKPKYISCFDFV